MGCDLNGYIRLRGCESGYTAEAGAYLDMLPSLSLANVSDMTDDKYNNAKALVEDKLAFALMQIKPYLFDALGKRGYQNQAFSMVESGTPQHRVNASSPNMRGLVVTNLQAAQSPNSSIFIDEITLHSPFPNLATNQLLFFYDDDSNLLHSQTLEGLTAKINKSFAVNRVFIFTDNTAFSTYYTSGEPTACCGVSAAQNGYVRAKQLLHFSGFDGTNFVEKNGFGITVKCSIKCDDSAVLCFFKEELKPTLLYLTAAAIAEDVAVTNRINYLTLNNREEAFTFAGNWKTDAAEHLQVAINKILTAMPTYDRVCLPCKSQYQTVNIKPA